MEPTFYQIMFVSLFSFLLVHAFLHPASRREWRTAFLVAESLVLFMLNQLKPIRTPSQQAIRQKQVSVWTSVLFLYFIHTTEYVHPDHFD